MKVDITWLQWGMSINNWFFGRHDTHYNIACHFIFR